MTDERFNELLTGPLSHSLFPFQITRLVLALRAVVEATGEAGDQALEQFCRDREVQDRLADRLADHDPHDDPDPLDTCRSCGSPLGSNPTCDECRHYGRPQ